MTTQNSKGQKSDKTVFNGIYISLEPVQDYQDFEKSDGLLNQILQSDLEIQIAPISKIGRLFQDTVSSISGALADVRFSNEELNDVLSLKIENLLSRTEKLKELSGKFSTSMEEILYQLYKNYGPFYMKIHKGKISIAFNYASFNLFNNNKSFSQDYLLKESIDEKLISPKKWGHLLYLIGVCEALKFHLLQMSVNNLDDKHKLASDFDNLLTQADLESEDLTLLEKEIKQDTQVGFVLSNEVVSQIKQEYENKIKGEE